MNDDLAYFDTKENDAVSGQWQVSKFQDSIRHVSGKHDPSGWAMFFDDEAEARAFVVDRARQNVEQAEADLRAARRRLKKCQKKFAPTEQPNATPLEPPK